MITTEPQSTYKLVLAAQGGDTDAFSQLYEWYYLLVQGVVRVTSFNQSEVDVDNLAHEVFAIALENLSKLESPHAFKNWLRTTARNVTINYYKRKMARLKFYDDLRCLDLRLSPANQQDPLRHLWKREVIALAMSKLPDLDRATLEAFYFRNLSVYQMADYFDAPLGTIKRRLHMARKRLRRELLSLGVKSA
jgi:RNA polymerase sigma-70 factor (ECF subfamily)